jgi:hypothetical protein
MGRVMSPLERVGLAVFLFAFVVYRMTLAPGLDFIDSGELSAAACTLGIAHPTGYPLFTMLGWVFSKLPFGAEPIVRLNTMSAVLCACAVYVVLHIVHRVLSSMASGGRTLSDRTKLAASAASALLLAFSLTFWATAVAIEVYALHALLLSVILYTFLRANEKPYAAAARGSWYVFAFAVGLGFANHATTSLLAPGLLTLFFAVQGFRARSFALLARLVLPFAAGLSAILYLPLRASQSPVMNWGNPVTLERLLWHAGAKQYRVWLFSSEEVMGKQLAYFLGRLLPEFAYVGAPLALVGVVVLWRAARRLAIGTIVLFLGCVAFSINYDIHDIDSYFLLAYVTMAIWAGCGLAVLLAWLEKKTSSFSTGAACAWCITAVPFGVNYADVDKSDDHLVDDYTTNIFGSLEENAVVVSQQWDFWVSAAYYRQLVRRQRTDVVVIDPELLRRSWYFLQLEHRYPWLIEQSRAEVDAFLADLHQFEHDSPREAYPEIEAHYGAMILSFIRKSMATRPVYVTGEVGQARTPGLQRVPQGLVLRLYPDVTFHASDVPELVYRPPVRKGRLEDLLRTFYASAFVARGEYYLLRGRLPDEAQSSFEKALSYDPESPGAKHWLERLKR